MDLEALKVTMLLDEIEIHQKTAKSQEHIQQEIHKINMENYQQGLLPEPEVKALLMEVASHISFNNNPLWTVFPLCF